MALDLSPIRAHVSAVTSVVIVNEKVQTSTVDTSEVVGFVCIEHPEFLWSGAQWSEVLKHLVTHHGASTGTAFIKGSPFQDSMRVTEYVQVGVQPPSDE